MFAYCTQMLHLSEFEAYLRITAARAARQHPLLLAMLREGSLHLTAVAKLAPHLTPENCEPLARRAAHRTKREIEELIAELAPRPDAPTVVRKLPDRGAATTPVPALRHDSNQAASCDSRLGPDRVEFSGLKETPESAATGLKADAPPLMPGLTSSDSSLPPAPDRPPRVESLSPGRYRIQFTAGTALRDKLERLQALMRSSVPDGDLAAIIEQAVTEKLESLEARRFAKTKAPRKSLVDSDTSPSSRHIPAAIRRIVHERDGGRCRYVDGRGHRCTARGDLEFHHRHPFGHGGDHSPEGISLLCRAHNRYLAEIDYGRQPMAKHRRLEDHAST